MKHEFSQHALYGAHRSCYLTGDYLISFFFQEKSVKTEKQKKGWGQLAKQPVYKKQETHGPHRSPERPVQINQHSKAIIISKR